ncbi:hypothetical protein MHUMG1_06657 [Metarhizium humberi]|uniref:Uncharacterized protein n=1 Tax=Metarhizium humberi TaxID=2596975 RepID=A0A9P8M8I1_9HYPO|nr:hypothetical protein MHUMG1_06657 [Metarhizium humberi]
MLSIRVGATSTLLSPGRCLAWASSRAVGEASDYAGDGYDLAGEPGKRLAPNANLLPRILEQRFLVLSLLAKKTYHHVGHEDTRRYIERGTDDMAVGIEGVADDEKDEARRKEVHSKDATQKGAPLAFNM